MIALMAATELEIFVAERVMGLKVNRKPTNYGPVSLDSPHPRYAFQVPPFSSQIDAAWLVVERMMALGYRYVMRGNFEGNQKHWCAFDEQEWADANPPYQSELCESLPLAICRAAVAAIERKDGQ